MRVSPLASAVLLLVLLLAERQSSPPDLRWSAGYSAEEARLLAEPQVVRPLPLALPLRLPLLPLLPEVESESARLLDLSADSRFPCCLACSEAVLALAVPEQSLRSAGRPLKAALLDHQEN